MDQPTIIALLSIGIPVLITILGVAFRQETRLSKIETILTDNIKSSSARLERLETRDDNIHDRMVRVETKIGIAKELYQGKEGC